VIDEALTAVTTFSDVDVQGARTICRKRRRDERFHHASFLRILRERLEQRKLDKAYVIEQRLRVANEEIRQFASYDYLIINSDLAPIEELKAIS